jgi:uncharacterized protein (TIGR00369 family)
MKGWISRAPFERLLNMEIIEAADGQAVLSMPFFLDYANGAGLMHGGALVSLADTALAMAVKTLIRPASHFATIELQTRFLAPVKKGIVTARSRVVHREGQLFKGEASVYDEEGRVVMEFSSTFKIAKSARLSGITFGDEGL